MTPAYSILAEDIDIHEDELQKPPLRATSTEHRSMAEIDRQLITKYSLSNEENALIEEKVQAIDKTTPP